MIELMLLLSLSPVNTASAPKASVEPCVWPNTCASQPAPAPAFQPCGTPNKCRQAASA